MFLGIIAYLLFGLLMLWACLHNRDISPEDKGLALAIMLCWPTLGLIVILVVLEALWSRLLKKMASTGRN
jgi:hypothetical protein